jgi:putative phosphoribosyl transferase
MLREAADEVVCVEIPPDLWAVGAWYVDFRPTTDEEVAALLAENAEASVGSRRPASP